ncbi:hypothetical protein Tco_1520012, partial [Tanacetum coccineum]
MRDIVRLKTERELVKVKIHDGNAFWNEIGVNAGVSKHKLTTVDLVNTVRLNLMLSVQVNAVEGDFINTSIKVKTVNEERQIQALVDKKRVIITETSIRSDLKLEDAGGIDCLPTATHEKRKKHFAALRAQEKRSKPPTKAQKRNTMSIYLKNMAGYKHNQLKRKSYDEIQEIFDKEMKRVNTFVDMNAKLVKGSKTKAEG